MTSCQSAVRVRSTNLREFLKKKSKSLKNSCFKKGVNRIFRAFQIDAGSMSLHFFGAGSDLIVLEGGNMTSFGL